MEDNLLITSEAGKEQLLFNTFFTGKHLNNLEIDQEHHSRIMEEYNKIMSTVNQCGIDINAEITEEEIKDAIDRQDTNNKSSDFNNIHPLILKNLGPSAIFALKILFNKILDSGEWIWDVSHVTFIRKENKAT